MADMRTGNYESALLRFQNRVGSTMLSDIVRGLVGTLRGDDQQMYFRMLVFDMRQIEQSNLKKEAGRRPKQMQKYSMMMLFCILLIYVVVLSVDAGLVLQDGPSAGCGACRFGLECLDCFTHGCFFSFLF